MNADRFTRLTFTVARALVVFALVFGAPLTALADQIIADADALVFSTPHGNSTSVTQSGGTTAFYDFSADIKNTASSGNDVFRSGHPEDYVTVTISRFGDWLNGGKPASFTFTGYAAAQVGTIGITLPCGEEGTTKTMTVVLSATASNGQTLNPNSVTLSYVITAGPDDSSCAPSNTAPTVTANDQVFDEGALTSYSASWSDPDSGQNHTCTIDFGDGSGTVSGTVDETNQTCTASHTYADGPNTYTITVSVNDGTASGSDTAQATVANLNPVVATSAWQNASVNCRTPATLTGISFSDSGVIDYPWNVNIDWGDGSTDTNYDTNTQGAQSNQIHTYNTPGTYSAAVGVTDKDSGFGSNTSSALTVLQTYTVDFLPPFDDSTPSSLIVNKMKYGRIVPVKVTIYDDCAQAYFTDPSASVTINVSKTAGTGTSDDIEQYADAGQSSSNTNAFRWTTDSTAPGGGFWIYNLDSKALTMIVGNAYRVDVYVGLVKATVNNWAVLMPVK